MDYQPILEIPVKVSTAPVEGNWTPVMDKLTADGGSYSGPAQVALFEWSVLPEQAGSVNTWLVNNLVNKATAEAIANGCKVLRVRLWRDTGPTFSTPYLCELTITDPARMAQGASMEMPQLVILAIITVALAAILVWLIVKPLLRSIEDIIYGPANGDGTRTPWYQSLFLPAAVLGGIYLLTQNTGKATKKKA
jgi:hypothetical protein